MLAVELGLALVFVLLSALVSAAEAALFSLPPATRARLADADAPVARHMARLAEDPRSLLFGLRLVDTVANVAAVVLAAHLAGHLRASIDAPPGAVVALVFASAVLVLLVFGEALPRLIGTRAPLAVMRHTRGLAAAVATLVRPFARPLARWSMRVEQRMGEAEPLTPDDLITMADIAQSQGTLDHAERDLIAAVIEFGETTAREIMTARADVVCIPVTATAGEAAAVVRESGHSRLPVVDGSLDTVVGLLVAKDLLSASPEAELRSLLRPPFVVPDSLRLDALMEEFRRRRTHVALVVDEYGSTAGLVTMEDVLEEVVGEIRDERDTDERPELERVDDGVYRLDARLHLDDLSDALGLALDTDAYDFDTVGGLMLHVAGHVPEVGETVETTTRAHRLCFTAESRDGLRVGDVRLVVSEMGEAIA